MTIHRLSDAAYQQLIANATVLKQRRGMPAILLTPDQLIIKHIYHRAWFSSSRIWPYAQRFVHSAELLHERGILAPKVKAQYYYPTGRCDILIYDFLEGKSLHTYASENNYSHLENFTGFIAKLHDLGIFFRDLHFDNVIVHKGEFALIDIASVRFRRWRRSLNLMHRAKNLVHMFSKNEDQAIYRVFGKNNFLCRYAEYAKLSTHKVAILHQLINKYTSRKSKPDTQTPTPETGPRL